MNKKLILSLVVGWFAMTVNAEQARINNGAHWYDGEITFTATSIENNNVLMNAMDEGEEHEFVLRYM